MKKTAMFVSMVFAASLAWSGTALAAGEQKESKDKETYGATSGQAGQDQQRQQDQAAVGQEQQQKSGIQQASDIKGFKIQNAQGEEVGEISELLVDVQEGKIGYAVVSKGGVLGMGEEQYIVPFNALSFDQQNQVLTLDVQEDQLKQAPSGDVAQQLDRQQGQEIHQFYGVSPYWEEGSGQQQQQPQDQLQQDQLQQEQPQQDRMQQDQKPEEKERM